MLNKLQGIVFFAIIFFLPFQVGYHFWPEFSYVNGVRIDYLSPTLYLLDILIFGWILVQASILIKSIRNINLKVINGTYKILLLVFILDLVLNIFWARSPLAHTWGIIKLIELSIFGFLVAITFTKKNIPNFVFALSLGGIISSVLAIWQFLIQSSVGSFWYFLGERTFNTATIGISTVNINQQLLRAYAAFPHPNVLAFFLLVATVFIITRIPYEKNVSTKIFLSFAIILFSVSISLTFSRIIILLDLIFFLYYFWDRLKKVWALIVIALVSVLGLTGPQFILRGVDFRGELFSQSYKIFLENPYFGIGLNNFFIYQAPLIKNISPINFQPVHNIFILALLSFGIFGVGILIVGFIRVVTELKEKIQELKRSSEVRDFYKGVFFLLMSIIIVGIFDHFPLTLEQGQIMLALVVGLSLSKLK